jgi:hypothetical protein
MLIAIIVDRFVFADVVNIIIIIINIIIIIVTIIIIILKQFC